VNRVVHGKKERGKHDVIFCAYNGPLPHIRVARWYVFKPKVSIWINFGGT
jgi:hypothetical protein